MSFLASFYGQRNSRKAIRPEQKAGKVEHFVAYQYRASEPTKDEVPQLLKRMKDGITESLGVHDVKVLNHQPWQYCPIFSQVLSVVPVRSRTCLTKMLSLGLNTSESGHRDRFLTLFSV